MRITSLMLGGSSGKAYANFMTYVEVLHQHGHSQICFVPVDSLPVFEKKFPFITVYPVSWKTWIAVWLLGSLQKEIQAWQPDLIVAHGKKASRIGEYLKKIAPTVAIVSEGYFRRALQQTAIICKTKKDQSRYKKRAFFVPPMIDLPPIVPTPHTSTPPILGVLGDFKRKERLTLLSALSLLHQKGYPFRLLINRPSKIPRKILSFLTQRFELRKNIIWSEKRIENFLSDVDLLCFYQTQESSSEALITAMTSSTPIILLTDRTSPPIITHGYDGFVIPPENDTLLAHIIEILLQRPKMAQRYAENAYQHVFYHYSKNVVGKRLSALLTEIRDRGKNVPGPPAST